MDPVGLIIYNIREKLGCNGLRNLTDLAQMRQETLEKRLFSSRRNLSSQNIASIYAAWLSQRICQKQLGNPRPVVEKMCSLLWQAGCEVKSVLTIWMDCAAGQSIVHWQTPALQKTLQGIGDFLVNAFPRGADSTSQTSLLDYVHQAEQSPSKNRGRSRSPRKPRYEPRSFGDSYRPHRSRSPLARMDRSRPSDAEQQRLQTKADGPWRTLFSDVAKAAQQPGEKVIKAENAENSPRLSGVPFVDNMRPLFGPSKVTNGSQPLAQKEKASHKSIEPEVPSRSLPAGPDPTQRAQPKTPARPLWASFSEASKSSQSPFAALAQKEPKVIKLAASVEYKAPPAAMAPDLVTGASGPRTNWLTSGGKSNEGRLSPWEEDKNETQAPVARASPTQTSAVVAHQFLRSLDQGNSQYTNGRPTVNSGNPSISSMPQLQSSHLGSWIDETQSSAASVSSFPHTPMSGDSPYGRARLNYDQTQDIELLSTHKPLIGYSPAVERLMRSQENVWVHHMRRKVALEFWGEYAPPGLQDCAPPRKGWNDGWPPFGNGSGSDLGW